MAEIIPQSHRRLGSLWKRISTHSVPKKLNSNKSSASSTKSRTKITEDGVKKSEIQNDGKTTSWSDGKLTDHVAPELQAKKLNPLDLVKHSKSDHSRRNAICEVLEKQCVDHELDTSFNLQQKRDCLRLEYVLREVCLI